MFKKKLLVFTHFELRAGINLSLLECFQRKSTRSLNKSRSTVNIYITSVHNSRLFEKGAVTLFSWATTQDFAWDTFDELERVRMTWVNAFALYVWYFDHSLTLAVPILEEEGKLTWTVIFTRLCSAPLKVLWRPFQLLFHMEQLRTLSLLHNKDESKVFSKIWRNRLAKFRDPHGWRREEICDILKIYTLENALPQQFHDNKCIWDSLLLYYFGYEVILFQMFFEYQNPEDKLSYVTNPETQINPEIFHPWHKFINWINRAECLYAKILQNVSRSLLRANCWLWTSHK